MNLLRDLQEDTGVGIIFITHDFGIVAKMCDRVAVMYAGKIVEQGDVREIFNNPLHPYTEALIRSVPKMEENVERLYAIPGNPPNVTNRPSGCNFQPDCDKDNPNPDCELLEPILQEESPGHWVAYCAACFDTHGCKWFPRAL